MYDRYYGYNPTERHYGNNLHSNNECGYQNGNYVPGSRTGVRNVDSKNRIENRYPNDTNRNKNINNYHYNYNNNEYGRKDNPYLPKSPSPFTTTYRNDYGGAYNNTNKDYYNQNKRNDYYGNTTNNNYISNTSSNINAICNSKIGLKNIGNTCYMNTCLQILIHCPEFMTEICKNPRGSVNNNSSIISKFYDISQQFITNNLYRQPVVPIEFYNLFVSKHLNFSNKIQHDTQEFCRVLLEDIQSDLNNFNRRCSYKEIKNNGKDKAKCFRDFQEIVKRNDSSPLTNLVYGQLVSSFMCDLCMDETYFFQQILDLPLLMGNTRSICISIEQLISNHFSNETIKFEEKCDQCKYKCTHTKRTKFSIPPKILICSLQKIDFETLQKNNNSISFREELDMTNFTDKELWNENKVRYSLFAIANHIGTFDAGHYFAFIKLNDGWYEFNDENVTRLNSINLTSYSAYVLFYKRI